MVLKSFAHNSMMFFSYDQPRHSLILFNHHIFDNLAVPFAMKPPAQPLNRSIEAMNNSALISHC